MEPNQAPSPEGANPLQPMDVSSPGEEYVIERLGCLGLIQRFPVSFALTVITVGFYFLEWLLGGTTLLEPQFRLGALRGDLVFQQGEAYRLACAVFLHHGLIHFGFNWFAFIQLGPIVEHTYGSWRLLAFYLLTGLVASFSSAYFLGAEIEGGSRGASGAILGLAGLILWAAYFTKDPFRGTLLDRAKIGRRLSCCLLFIFGLGIGLSFVVPVIDNWGHAGGFGAGLLLATLYKDTHQPPGKGLKVLAVVLAVAFLASFAWMAVDGAESARKVRQIDALSVLPGQVAEYRAEGRIEAGRAKFTAAVAEIERVVILNALYHELWLERYDREVEIIARRWYALQPNDPHVQNSLAWVLVTSEDEARRDPEQALRLVNRSLAGVEREDTPVGRSQRSAYLDTQAEALFQLGRLGEALAAQREAVKLQEGLKVEPGFLDGLYLTYLKKRYGSRGRLPLEDMQERLNKIEAAAAKAGASVAPVKSG